MLNSFVEHHVATHGASCLLCFACHDRTTRVGSEQWTQEFHAHYICYISFCAFSSPQIRMGTSGSLCMCDCTAGNSRWQRAPCWIDGRSLKICAWNKAMWNPFYDVAAVLYVAGKWMRLYMCMCVEQSLLLTADIMHLWRTVVGRIKVFICFNRLY